jgi:GT2 family glycosyltransferase
MNLSILLVSYNTRKLTLSALDSIFKSLKGSNISYEVLVFDNHSADGSQKAIKQYYGKKVTLIESQENLGFGRANNLLAQKASGRYLLLLNSDIEVLENGISQLLTFFEKEKYDFVGGKLLNSDLSPQPSAGPLYSPLIALIALFFRGDYWGITRSSPEQARRVGWVSGACILTKRKTYLALGGFDEGIFLYMEEIDLFKRAKDNKLTVGFCPATRFIHHGFASSGTKSRPVINVFRGYQYYYHKHYSYPAQLYIRFLLKTKAVIGYTLGVVFKNQYLKQTYYEAYKIVG